MPGTAPPDELRALAVELAVSAAGIALGGRRGAGAARLEHDTKSSTTDPVTASDRAAERLIRAELAHRRPTDGIVGEEERSRPGSSGLVWHVDPIDGTVNFIYGLPFWATSIAVVDERGPVAGAVCAPVLGETYSAARQQGADLNGRPLGLDGARALADSLVGTGFSYSGDVRAEQSRVLAELLPHVRDIRRLGSAALDLCMVASGRLDGYFERGLNSWDRLAGELIVTEAGGVVSGPAGGPPDGELIVASCPSVHGDLVRLVVDAIGRAG